MPELKQINENEVLDENDRVVRGWASVEMKDKQGEIIKIDELEKAMAEIMERGGIIIDSHSNRIVGKIRNYEVKEHPKSKTAGVSITYKIHKLNKLDDQIWGEIKSGERKGLSFGGMRSKKKMDYDKFTKEPAISLIDVSGFEISSVKEPANPLSLNVEANLLAKSANIKKDTFVVALEGGRKVWIQADSYDEAKRLAQEKYEDQLVEVLRAEKERVSSKDLQVMDGDTKNYIYTDSEGKIHHITYEEAMRRIESGTKKEDIEVQKPFAGYEDFEACVSDQKSKGKDEESANKICGFLQARTEKFNKEIQEILKPERESIHSAKWHRCVEHVKEQGTAESPEAVCTAQLGEESFKGLEKSEDLTNEDIKKIDIFVKNLKFITNKNKFNTNGGLKMQTKKSQVLKEVITLLQELAKQEETEELPEKKPEEDEKKKEQVKLPEVTSQPKAPETDEVKLTSKVEELTKEIAEIKKGFDSLSKSSTPRPEVSPIAKTSPAKKSKVDEVLERFEKGEIIDIANLNREVNEYARKINNSRAMQVM